MIVKDNGGDFTPAPEGMHQGVCVDVIDKGEITSEYQGSKRTRHVVVVRWAIDENMENGKPFTVEKWYTASLNEKASLRKDLQLWRGRSFTAAELQGFELDNVLGVNCQLAIIHQAKGDRVYANVSGILPLPKGAAKMSPPADYIRVQDRPAENGNNPGYERDPGEDDDDLPPLPF